MALDAVMNAVSTATGSVEKAYIRLRDQRSLKEKDLKPVGPTPVLNSPLAGLVDTSALSAATSIAGSIRSAVSSKLGLTSQAPAEYNKSIEVQFNPSSIKISGHAGDDDVQITSYSQDGCGIHRGSANLQMDFSVSLIFDQVSNTAAFQQDLLTISSSRGIQTGAKIAGDMVGSLLGGGKPQSLQVTVEAFIAALRNDKTRMVCFEWGELMYEGMLRQVNTNYTMFDMLGNPVRAEVSLVIYLMETSEKGISDYTNRYWQVAYEEAFINGNPFAESILNLNRPDFSPAK